LKRSRGESEGPGGVLTLLVLFPYFKNRVSPSLIHRGFYPKSGQDKTLGCPRVNPSFA